MNLCDFFRLLYDDKPDGSHLLIWRPGKKRGGSSFWTPDIDQAVDFILKNPKRDQYFQVGLSGKKYKKDQRCHLDESKGRPVIALPAVFADIDFGTCGHHKSKRYPPTLDDAMSVIHGHGFDPTVVVHSGHGLQAYWVFKEMWELKTPEDRISAMKFLRRIKLCFHTIAMQQGWSIDSVQDLVRILRPPESYNCKKDPVIVKIIEFNDLRYNPGDLEEFLPDDTNDNRSTDSSKINLAGKRFILAKNRQPPPAKFAQLWAIFGKFQATWENQRQGDLNDTSPSGYDMALAGFAARAKWKPQEIVDLLIAHREYHGHDLKFNNTQYYARTIINARDDAISESFEIQQDIKNLQLSEELNPSEEDSPSEKLRKDVSIRMGVKIIKIEKYLSEDPDYVIHIEYNGKVEEITLKIQHFTSQPQFRNKIAATTGKIITRFKPKEWDNHIQQLLILAEENVREIGEEVSDKGVVKYWIEDYLESSNKLTLDEAVIDKQPFIHNGCWYIFLDNFSLWTKIKKGADIRQRQLGTLIRRLGCINQKFNVVLDNHERTSRSAFRVPREIGPQPSEEHDDEKSRENAGL